MSTISELTKIAKEQIGNNGSKYRKWFYNRTTDYYGVNWCAVFISWLFNQVGELNKLVPKTDGAGCFAREYDGKNGKWYESEYSDSSTTPKPGDIVTFTWNGAGCVAGQDKYYSNHVGYVYAVDSTYIYTIEGNTGSNDADTSVVAYKQYSRKSGNINGYFRPNYESEETEMNFKKGDKSDGVLAYKSMIIQARTLGLITQKVNADNVFGDGTLTATKQVQKKYGLEVDGIAGTKTITALNKAISEKVANIYKFTTMQDGDWNLGVASLKTMCDFAKELGLITASVDTKLGFGDGTVKAIKQIQALIGEKQTGVATEYTIKQFRVISKNALKNKLSK